MLLLNRRRYMHASNDVIMTTATNPEVLAICYAQGWCASADKMTKSEAEAVGDIGSAFKFSDIVHFDEFQYFTNVTSVGYYSMQGCASLVSITLPISVTYIDTGAFMGCTALTTINLENVLTFGSSVFQNCNALTSATLHASAVINTNLFANCTSLATIVLPTTLTALPNYVLARCGNLVLTELPSGVTSLGAQAFYACESIAELTLPSGVTTIGTQAFMYARGIGTFTCLATTAPSIENNTFDYMGQNASTRTLRVPSGASGYDQGYWLDLQTTAAYPFTLEYI